MVGLPTMIPPRWFGMREDNFRSFVEILKFLKREDLNKKSIETAIIKLIISTEKDMTKEQKSKLVKKFQRYEIKKVEGLLGGEYTNIPGSEINELY